jgi:CII-binding regulator of phage lambda lysogenization HflD
VYVPFEVRKWNINSVIKRKIMNKDRTIVMIRSRISILREQVNAFDKEGRNVDLQLAKIEAYEDAIYLLSE